MKTLRMLSLLCALTLSAAVTGCWNDDDDEVASPPIGTGPGTVPDTAGASSTSFVSYLMGLTANDETSEPVIIPSAFLVPADETADAKPLT